MKVVYTKPEDVKDRALRMQRRARIYVPLTFAVCILLLALICGCAFALAYSASPPIQCLWGVAIIGMCGLFYFVYIAHIEWYQVKDVFGSYGNYQGKNKSA